VPDVSATNFAFLTGEWSAVFEAAAKAESFVHADPRAACFYARRALELAVAWAYKSDASLHLPYQDNLSALIHEPTFKVVAGGAVFSMAGIKGRRPWTRSGCDRQPVVSGECRRTGRRLNANVPFCRFNTRRTQVLGTYSYVTYYSSSIYRYILSEK
jgi:hypothetical protein